jgi:hypothetical protein
MEVAMLFTKDGCFPQPLPEADYRLSDGHLMMPLEGHPDAIEACGWVVAPPVPVFDPDFERPGWDGAAWTVEAISAEEIEAREKMAVPLSVTPRQLRLALLGAGKLGQVQAFVGSGAAPEAAVISWEYATEFLRSDPMLNQLAGALQPPMTGDQIDQLFVAAAQIQ